MAGKACRNVPAAKSQAFVASCQAVGETLLNSVYLSQLVLHYSTLNLFTLASSSGSSSSSSCQLLWLGRSRNQNQGWLPWSSSCMIWSIKEGSSGGSCRQKKFGNPRLPTTAATMMVLVSHHHSPWFSARCHQSGPIATMPQTKSSTRHPSIPPIQSPPPEP